MRKHYQACKIRREIVTNTIIDLYMKGSNIKQIAGLLCIDQSNVCRYISVKELKRLKGAKRVLELEKDEDLPMDS